MKPPVPPTLCLRCGRVFDPVDRDVSEWPLIEDANASEHCGRCWMELARERGRKLGQVGAGTEQRRPN